MNRRGAARALGVLLMVLMGMTFTTGTAQACSCAGGSKAQQFKGADAVFTGEIVDRSGERWIDYGNASGPGQFTYTVDVERVFKGEVSETQKFVSGTQSSACGAVFPKDGPILVFGLAGKGVATGKIASDQYSTGLCSGSYVPTSAPTGFGEGAPPPTSAGYDASAVQTDPDYDMGQSAVPSWVLVAGVAFLVAAGLGLGLLVARRRRD